MKTEKKPRFSHSFHPKVKPPKGEPCSSKWHYTGVMRELVGFLDEMAALDPERFVFTSVDYILKHEKCKRFKGDAYGERAVRYALAELRRARILSKPLCRDRWVPSGTKGHEVQRKLTGSIMAPHACLAVTEGDVCHMRGWLTNGKLTTNGRWAAAEPGNPNSIYWAGYSAGQSAVPSAPRVHPECSAECTPECSAECTPSAVPSAVTNSRHVDEPAKVNHENRGQAVISGESVISVPTLQPSKPFKAPPHGGAAKNGGREGGEDLNIRGSAPHPAPMAGDDDPFGETTSTHGDEPSEAELCEHAWKEFKRGLPPELEQMVGDDEKNLRAQIEECDQYDCNGLWVKNCGASIVLGATLRWVAKREADGSPLRTLKVRRWSWWFKECENHLAAEKKRLFVSCWRRAWECAWKTLHIDAFKGEILEGYTNPLPWDVLLTREERVRMLTLHRVNKRYFNAAVWNEKNITHFVDFGIPNGLTIPDLHFVQSIAKRYAPPEPDEED
jgi:hypothetical protein